MTAKFDPVAFYAARLGDMNLTDAIRALAAEAAKQQARRDAEIAREYETHLAAKKIYGLFNLELEKPKSIAQAIEREAGLTEPSALP